VLDFSTRLPTILRELLKDWGPFCSTVCTVVRNVFLKSLLHFICKYMFVFLAQNAGKIILQ